MCSRISSLFFLVALTHGFRPEHSAGGMLFSSELSDDFEFDDKYKIQVSNGQEVINCTLTQNGQQRHITVTVIAFQETFLLDLSLNTYLFAIGYTEKSVRRSGHLYRTVNHTESNCYYVGNVRNKPHSTAAVSTCKGIVGHFTIGNMSYHIEPEGRNLSGPHRVFRSRPNAKTIFRCGTEHESIANLMNAEAFRRRMRRSFRWPQDEDKKNKVVELYIANDAISSALYGPRGIDPFERTKDIVNIASSLYQPLGIYLVLVGIEVWTNETLIAFNYSDSIDTLYKWYSYRMNYILPLHPHDSAVLITSRTFLGGVIGRAVMGYMCSQKYSGAVISDVYFSASAAGNTVAHEIGHTFGLAHDNSSCDCDDSTGACIMNAYTNLANPGTKWSSCSLNTLDMKLDEGVDLCLYNIPTTLFQASPICGNGIVEDGEQCDCGKAPSKECNRSCCDSKSCQLIASATCAYGRCCDISKCQVRSSSILCRKRIGIDCDLDEYCNGIDPTCPIDTYKPDGTSCTVKGEPTYCYQGRCRSLRSQCELLWGPESKESDPLCFTYFNLLGTYYGNCGANLIDGTYKECLAEDTFCGRLHCKVNQTDSLVKYQNYLFKSEAEIGTKLCTAVLFDYGNDTPDPGLSPDGAKCGDGKMCLKQKCVSVNSVKVSCSDSCQKQEVCNNLGVCQRESSASSQLSSRPPDFSQVTKTTDSNNATDPNINETFTVQLTTKTPVIIISTLSSSLRTPSTTSTTTTISTTTSPTHMPTTTLTTLPTTTTTTTTTTLTMTTTPTTKTTLTTTTKPTTTTTSRATSTSATTTTPTTTSTTITPSTTSTTTTPASSSPKSTTTSSRFSRRTPAISKKLTPSSSTTASSTVSSTTSVIASSSSTTTRRRLTPAVTEYPKESTTTVDPLQGIECTFGAYLDRNLTGKTSLLNLNGLLANRNKGFSLSTNFFMPRLTINQYIYTEICAGLLPFTTAQLKTLGCYPYLSFDWLSTSHDGVDSGCRGGVLSASRGILISLSQRGEGLYGSDLLPTSWSMFSITDTMRYSDRLLSLFGSRSSSENGVIPLQNSVATPTASTLLDDPSVYTCTAQAEAHFFSMSVGVPTGASATVELRISGATYTFEMTRQNEHTTGTTTLARTVLAPCVTDAQMVLVDGRIVPGVNLISFTAFPYQLRSGTSIAWAGYVTSDIIRAGAVTYDLWLVKAGVKLTRYNTTVEIPVSGYYYVYLSAGVPPRAPVTLVILKNGERLFGLTRASTDHSGLDMIGHGMVVSLMRNDFLRVEAATEVYSSNIGLHTSFIGMLLYRD